MDRKNFIPKRKIFTFTQTINAEPEKIFPLLCPVREEEWLDKWTYKMIYSLSGIAETGAVFSTSDEGEEDTIWIITKHNKKENAVEFARVTPNNRASVLEIKIRPVSSNKSFVDISYTYTGLTDQGNEFINGYSEEKFNKSMQFWQDSMNYFIETGKTLKH